MRIISLLVSYRRTRTTIFSTDVRRLTLAEMLQSLNTLETSSENISLFMYIIF